MPFVLTDLVIDRVDLVDEGANSAAFVELYKRKERGEVMDANEILEKMKPEHAAVIQEALNTANAAVEKSKQELEARESELSTANEALAKANAELDELKKACGNKKSEKACGGKGPECDPEDDPECDPEDDPEDASKACGGKKTEKSSGGASFDESEVIKSMPEAAREMFMKMREQKEAAEEQIRKAAEEKLEAEAVAKAASMKALPIEQEKLVGILKGCSPEIAELLGACSTALEGVVLGEVGKSAGNGASDTSSDAWAKIENKAEEIAKRDSVTKAKAVQIAINENPELYRDYINGGAN